MLAQVCRKLLLEIHSHFEDDIANVEYRKRNVIMISGKLCILSKPEDSRVAHVGPVDE